MTCLALPFAVGTSACEGEKPVVSESAVVLARHIDQLLDDPTGLPRAVTAAELPAGTTPAEAPAVATPTAATLIAAEADAGTTEAREPQPDARAAPHLETADVQASPVAADVVTAKAPPDVQIAPDVPVVPDVTIAPDTQAKPDTLGKADAAMMPIVPIPVRRDGTPIAMLPGVVKPDAKLLKPDRGVKPAVAAKPTLTPTERKLQAKQDAALAKAEAQAAAKKAVADQKRKAQAASRDKKKRAAAAKQKKIDAKKAAVLARKAAAWAKKHHKGVNPYAPAKPEVAKPAKAESAKVEAGKVEAGKVEAAKPAKPEAVKPAKPEPAKPEATKPVKPEPVKVEPVKPAKAGQPSTLAPVKGEPQGDATELFFSGKRKADAGDFRGAIEDFKASQASRPSPRTLTALGRAYFDAGEMNAAASVLRQAGHHDDALLLLGTLYQQTDKPEKARKVYEEFLKAHPDHAKADWVRRLLKTL